MCHCGGQCGQCGSGGLGRLMGALLPAGSQVKTGFEIDPGFLSTYSTADLQNIIEGCVYSTGGFDAVNVGITSEGFYTRNLYVVVAVTTTDDHAALEDVGMWIQGAIQACAPDLTILRKYDTVGQGATDSQGNPLPQGNQPPSGTPPGGAPGQCSWATSKSLGDYLACEFGVSTGSAVIIGVALTVGVLLALRR